MINNHKHKSFYGIMGLLLSAKILINLILFLQIIYYVDRISQLIHGCQRKKWSLCS